MTGYSTFILVAINPAFLKTYESSNVREHKLSQHFIVMSFLCFALFFIESLTGLDSAPSTLFMLASVYNDFFDGS